MTFHGKVGSTKWSTMPTAIQQREAAAALSPQAQQYTALARESKAGKYVFITADATTHGAHVRGAAPPPLHPFRQEEHSRSTHCASCARRWLTTTVTLATTPT